MKEFILKLSKTQANVIETLLVMVPFMVVLLRSLSSNPHTLFSEIVGVVFIVIGATAAIWMSRFRIKNLKN